MLKFFDFFLCQICADSYVNGKSYVRNIFYFISRKNFFYRSFCFFSFFKSSGCEENKNQAGKCMFMMNYQTVKLIIFQKNLIFHSHFERKPPPKKFGYLLYQKKWLFKLAHIKIDQRQQDLIWLHTPRDFSKASKLENWQIEKWAT